MPDPRIDYLETVSSVLLKFKADKWGKLVGAEENMALLTEFLDKTDNPVLVLTLNAAGMIIPCLGFPESLKSKGVYFIKTKPENITKDNYKTRLIYGDISPTPVDQLIAVVEEVCGPRLAGAGPGGGGVGTGAPKLEEDPEEPKTLLFQWDASPEWPRLRAGWKYKQTHSR